MPTAMIPQAYRLRAAAYRRELGGLRRADPGCDGQDGWPEADPSPEASSSWLTSSVTARTA
jgi:hypothetical protein